MGGEGVMDSKIFVIVYRVFGFLRGVFFWVLFRAGRRSAGAKPPRALAVVLRPPFFLRVGR